MLDIFGRISNIYLPLQNSAVGSDNPVSQGAQSPESYFGGFFCARLAWQLQMVGRAGASSGAPVACVRFISPVRSATLPDNRDGGKQMHTRSPAMLKLFRGMLVPCFPRLLFCSCVVDLHSPVIEGGRNAEP